jgi:hypothetical protein
VAGSCEHGNELSASINAGNILTSRGTVKLCFMELFTWLVDWLFRQSVSRLVG